MGYWLWATGYGLLASGYGLLATTGCSVIIARHMGNPESAWRGTECSKSLFLFSIYLELVRGFRYFNISTNGICAVQRTILGGREKVGHPKLGIEFGYENRVMTGGRG